MYSEPGERDVKGLFLPVPAVSERGGWREKMGKKRVGRKAKREGEAEQYQ